MQQELSRNNDLMLKYISVISICLPQKRTFLIDVEALRFHFKGVTECSSYRQNVYIKAKKNYTLIYELKQYSHMEEK